MKLYYYSDMHLHENPNFMIENFGDQFKGQFNWKEKWLNKITNDDIVLIGGDTIWGSTINKQYKDVKPMLNEIDNMTGRKLIIMGNHCTKWYDSSKIRLDFKTIFPIDDCYYDIGNLLIIGSVGKPDNMKKYNYKKNYYTSLLNRMKYLEKEINLKSKIKILLLHHPPKTKRIEDLIEKYNFNIILYGHEHYTKNEINFNSNRFYIKNLSENNDYEPYHLDMLEYVDDKFKLVSKLEKINIGG